MTITQRLVPAHVAQAWKDHERICDLCGRTTSADGWGWPSKDNWGESVITLDALIGQVFPEGDFRTGYTLDLCPECFRDRLMPLVTEHLGVQFREYDPETGPPRTRQSGTP